MNLKWIKVSVRIPNLEGDGVAEIKTVRVPVTIDAVTGEELLTEEAVEIIDTTKARELKIQELQSELSELRNICQLRGEIIATAFEDGDLGIHEDRMCPMDSTCECKNILKLNKAMRGFKRN